MTPEELNDLEAFFKSADLPDKVSLNDAETITDVPLFVQSHLQTIRAYGDIPAFSMFRVRLKRLREVMEG